MRQVITKRLVWALLAASMFAAHPARADFASDVEAMMEQLVENEVATTVVPSAAAEFPATCDLLPATISALKAKRYTGIPAVIRKELADNAGLVAVLALIGGDLGKLPGLSDQSKVRQETIDLLGRILSKLGAIAITPLPKTRIIDTCSFSDGDQRAQALSTTVLQACATNTQSHARLELACALGLAVRDSSNGDSSLVRWDVQKGLVAMAAQSVIDAFPPVMGGASDQQFAQVVALIEKAQSSTPLADGLLAGSLQLGQVQALSAESQKLIQALASQIVALSKTPSESLEQVITTVTKFATLSSAAIPSGHDILQATLDLITQIAKGTSGVIADIQAKNYGAAAGDAFDAMSSAAKQTCESDSKKSKNDCSGRELVWTFLKATAVYAIDSTSGGPVGSTVSADFRSAAVDLIEASGGAGIRRGTFYTYSGQHAGWYFPNFTLREALRPGFAGPADPGTNARAMLTYASMDWPSFRFKIYPYRRAGKPLWIGGNFSVIDWIGPLWELSARNRTLASSTSGATRTKAFMLGFVVPRLELEFGIPELTKNLVVGIGVTARFYRADQNYPSSTTVPTIATYCIAGQKDNPGCNGSSFNGDNFEGSLFVKYVP
jgi:hypothetical protein